MFSQQQQKLIIERTEVKDGFFVYKIIITLASQPEQTLGVYYSATIKPYMILKIEAREGGLSFKGSEKKGFSLGDYSGYIFDQKNTLQVAKPPVPIEERPVEK